MNKIDRIKKDFYDKIGNWDFSEIKCEVESITEWDFYEKIKENTNEKSLCLDLGTGGGEKVLKNYPKVKTIIGIDYSKEMIKTANKNLLKSSLLITISASELLLITSLKKAFCLTGLALTKLGYRPVPIFNGVDEQEGSLSVVNNKGIELGLLYGAKGALKLKQKTSYYMRTIFKILYMFYLDI